MTEIKVVTQVPIIPSAIYTMQLTVQLNSFKHELWYQKDPISSPNSTTG